MGHTGDYPSLPRRIEVTLTDEPASIADPGEKDAPLFGPTLQGKHPITVPRSGFADRRQADAIAQRARQASTQSRLSPAPAVQTLPGGQCGAPAGSRHLGHYGCAEAPQRALKPRTSVSGTSDRKNLCRPGCRPRQRRSGRCRSATHVDWPNRPRQKVCQLTGKVCSPDGGF